MSSSAKAALHAFESWRSTIGLLMVEQFDYRFKGTRFGILITLVEPILVVAVTVALRLLLRGHLPAYGTSLVLFYSSGILAFYMYLFLMARARASVRTDPATRLPRTTSVDYLIAGVIVESALMLTLLILWFLGMYTFGIEEAAPQNIIDCIVALLLLAALGVGVGLTSASISRLVPYWRYVANRVTGRALMFVSGAFFIVDLLPTAIRDVVVWIPIVHGLEWFRLGLYGRYPVNTLDREYLIGWVMGAMFVGILLFRSQLRSPK